MCSITGFLVNKPCSTFHDIGYTPSPFLRTPLHPLMGTCKPHLETIRLCQGAGTTPMKAISNNDANTLYDLLFIHIYTYMQETLLEGVDDVF